MTARLHRGLAQAEARRLDGRRRNIVAALDTRGWQIGYDDATRLYWAVPPVRLGDGPRRRVALPGTLVSERQARNLETALRSIGPYPREARR